MGKLLSITGTDRVGKATQSQLLRAALERTGQPVGYFSFPTYREHWAAELIRAALNEEEVALQRRGGPELRFHPRKHPEIFQLLQMQNRLDLRGEMEVALQRGHVVCDRYALDAIPYGLADGCRLEWLLQQHAFYLRDDLAIVLVRDQSFVRPGEIPDLNERDDRYQQRVREAYRLLPVIFPYVTLLDVSEPFFADRWDGIHHVHTRVVATVNRQLTLGVTPLTRTQIYAMLEPGTPESGVPVEEDVLAVAS